MINWKMTFYAVLPFVVLLIQAGIAQAADAEKLHTFNLPAQPLATTLDQLAQASGTKLLYSDAAVQGIRAVPVQGRYTVTQALTRVLGNSGMRYQVVDNALVAVKKDPPNPVTPVANDGSEQTMPKVTVEADSEYDAEYYADPYNKDYVIPNATAGTKTDTPIMETPLNVQVISKQLLKERQTFTLADALKNVSGVTTNSIAATGNQKDSINGLYGRYGGSDQTLFLRGFESQTFFRNGFRLQEGSASKGFANVESVEVLKGPAAILYGQVEPGGMVNVVTKQPLATPYYGFTQQFGSFDTYRSTLDTTGPIAGNKDLLYRANLSYENSGSFRQFVGKEDVFFAPVLQWNISPRTQATFEVEYNRQHLGLDDGFVPAIPGLKLPFNSHINYGDYSPGVNETIFGGLRWQHQFNDDWALKHSFSVNQRSQNLNALYPRAAGSKSYLQKNVIGLSDKLLNTLPEDIYVWRQGFGDFSQSDTYATNLDLVGHFETWDLKHTLLMGGDYYRMDSFSGFDPILFDNEFNAGDFLPLLNPVRPTVQRPGVKPTLFVGPSSTATDQYGLYIQDQIKLPYDLHVTGGIRWQYIHGSQISRNPDGSVSSTSAYTQDAVTPRAGILWNPKKWLSLYANYSESFGSNPIATGGIPLTFVRDKVGKAIEPTSAEQYEGGIKFSFFDNKLRGTFAYYDLTKTNLAVGDPDRRHNCGNQNPAPNSPSDCSVALGKVRSRGPEIDITGEILPGWNIIATWANTDINILQTDPDGTDFGGGFFPGARLPNTTRNTGSVWSTYEIQDGDFKGLQFGGGINLTGRRLGSYITDLITNKTINKPPITPGYVTFDLMAGYSRKVGDVTLGAQLNVTNLLDKQYYTSIQPSQPAWQSSYASYGQPRTFMGQISIQY